MFWHWAGVDDNAPNGEGSTICAPPASPARRFQTLEGSIMRR